MDKEFLKETYNKIRDLELDNEMLKATGNKIKKELVEKKLEFEIFKGIVKKEREEHEETLEKRDLLVDLLERELLLKTRKIEKLERKIKGD